MDWMAPSPELPNARPIWADILISLSDFIIYAAIPISLVVITNYGTILLFDLDDPHFLRQCVFIDVPISNFGGADTGIKHTQRGHNGNYA